MKKPLFLYPILMALAIVFSSCHDENHITLGTVEFYTSFWWSDADTAKLTKTIVCDFSEDAKKDPKAFAELAFVRNDGMTVVPSDELTIYIDGEKQPQNQFRIYSKESEKNIEIIFGKAAKAGKHQGYLKLVNSNLDKVDNYILTGV